MPEDMEILKMHVRALNSLLESPEPGLFTWQAFVAEQWEAISSLRPKVPACSVEGCKFNPEHKSNYSRNGVSVELYFCKKHFHDVQCGDKTLHYREI